MKPDSFLPALQMTAGILLVVGLGVLFYLLLIIIFEIPAWIRSIRLSRLAKRNGLTFVRARKGWFGGWLSFQNDERNYIFGKISNFPVDFCDITLVQGTLAFWFKPSIARASDAKSLKDNYGASAVSKRISRLNQNLFLRLKVAQLESLFAKALNGEITRDEEVKSLFRQQIFSGQLMRNYPAAWAVSAPLLALSFLLISITIDGYPNAAWWIIGLFNLLINIPIFLVVSKKYGKKFSPKDINKGFEYQDVQGNIKTDPKFNNKNER